ncbi:uncharacterized protein LOC116767576 [Danaus plexippus]|uniref:uncharacterized protein LOC116767576 n=1 Tax=Danaus plexippus TaxID=13037 RepID=UPI002AB2B776|nr:uncharacterized protein LOC116767576 [Danaus plexippus]
MAVINTLQAFVQTALALSFIFIAAFSGLEVIPERAKLEYVNEKYFYNLSVNVKRYSRSSSYYFNIEMTTKHVWTNNVTLHLIFNEYLHNEYQSSFIQLHHRFCDIIKYDKFIGTMVKQVGLECPMPAGTLQLMNFTLSLDKFPNVFPFQKCRVDAEVTITATNESMAAMCFYVSFKDTKRT